MKQYFKALIDRSSEPQLLLDAEKKPILCNAAFASRFGLPNNDSAPGLVYKVWPALKDLTLGEGTVKLLLKGGKDNPLFLDVCIERLGSDAWLILPQFEDRLENRQIDFHAERLQTLGMLAGGVAHDFNNILAGIIGHTSYLKTILSGIQESGDSLRSIEDGAKKASLIIQQILNFSRLEVIETQVACDLVTIVQRTAALLKAAINPDIQLSVTLPDEPLRVLGIEARIAQVIVNLVVNARDAIKGEGTISIRVSQRVPKAGGALMGLLEVEDSGEGMSPETLQRAFEPYFSTKQERGTGIGLSTVHTIVDQSNGVIDVTSVVGKGTTFAIFFPLSSKGSEQQSGVTQAKENSPVRSHGHESILIVDDESPVRQVLALSLQHLGYKVSLAQSGVEAIERFRDKGERFDLVILDMLMPQLSGEEVFFALQAMHPEIRALIISGFSSEEAVENILQHGGKGFLQKPFTMAELSLKVRECLA